MVLELLFQSEEQNFLQVSFKTGVLIARTNKTMRFESRRETPNLVERATDVEAGQSTCQCKQRLGTTVIGGDQRELRLDYATVQSDLSFYIT